MKSNNHAGHTSSSHLEIITQIQTAEKKAKEIVEGAQKQCTVILEDAQKQYALRLAGQKEAVSGSQAKQISQKQEELERASGKVLLDAKKEVLEIHTVAKRNHAKAVSTILKRFREHVKTITA